MLRRNLYYRVKPYIPKNIRYAIRRFIVLRQRENNHHIWPIDEDAKGNPPNWRGWPNRKSFAFVITHDVEGQHGLDQTLQLAELEESLGFRSSFNFIPEGEYQVPQTLIKQLKDRGFEVGVHDLHHDGKLFDSRAGFAKKAKRINHYINAWNASGYRSGFMLRNLDWIHDLDIKYDASTFDTDPFEPQPDGVKTIFPYWIENHAVKGDEYSGYVELPYTIAQDSTLFLILQEKNIDIWKKKIDWIATNGGMVLVNVHPDYICFDNRTQNSSKFPVSLYQDLLQYILTKYEDIFWHALPNEVARLFHPNASNHGNFGNACH